MINGSEGNWTEKAGISIGKRVQPGCHLTKVRAVPQGSETSARNKEFLKKRRTFLKNSS
jgi:hypothetical protein